jgi:hypothetical protein
MNCRFFSASLLLRMNTIAEMFSNDVLASMGTKVMGLVFGVVRFHYLRLRIWFLSFLYFHC